MNRWTVHVTDFGKVEEADVQVAPLTLFLGDNNSGKSYMMTLIYGLLNARFYFDDYVFGEETEIYAECCHILDNMLRDVDRTTDVEYRLDAKEQHSFQLLLNEVLTRNKQRFLKNLFNREDGDWGPFCKNFRNYSHAILNLCIRMMIKMMRDILQFIV